MNDLLDTVDHNLLTVLPTAYLIWKNILPEKALWVHLMSKAVSVTVCGICFNKVWERFSDQWALTFEEGKTNFSAPDVTFVFPSWLWPCNHGNLERCSILLALEVINFFPTRRPRLFFFFYSQRWKCFFWDALHHIWIFSLVRSCVHGANIVYMFVCVYVCSHLSVCMCVCSYWKLFYLLLKKHE